MYSNKSSIPTRIQNIINDFIEEITPILGNRIKKIILYGSYARGDYKKNSDIDIIISSILKNIDKFNHLSNILPFYTNVNTEGIVLSD